MKWLQGLRTVYGLEFDAIGCRNEKGVSFAFVEMLRAPLDANGFKKVKVHAFDNWPSKSLDFVEEMPTGKVSVNDNVISRAGGVQEVHIIID